MAGHSNFQNDNAKYTRQENRSDYNASHNSTVEAKGDKEYNSFNENLDKYVEFLSWAR